MKRIVTLLLAAGLVLGAAAGSQAADIKAKGMWQNAVSWADRNFAKGNEADNFVASTRLRTQIDVIASESLKGVLFLEMGHQNWGNQAQGGALGTDGKVVKVRYSYVDWVIPQTDAKVRVGLQPYALPNFVLGSPILDADGAGITVSGQFTENVGASAFWMRAEAGNTAGVERTNPHDKMDFVGVTVPVTFDGVKVTPWGMYGIIGQDSFNGSGDVNDVATAMLPLGGAAAVAAGNDAHGNAWWVGVASELTYFDPFRIAFDAAYGSVDLGNTAVAGGHMDLKRSGWYAALAADYKTDYFTPGLRFWYASGDDAKWTNGSERMPSIYGDVTATSYGFDGTNYSRAAQTMGYSIDGTWGVIAQAANISFMEDLSHTFRVGYYQGTNNREMVRNGMIGNPQDTAASMMYLTTSDKAVEVNLDTEYKIYKDLSMFVELGYIRLDLDEDLWKTVGYEANKNNFKGAVSLKYAF